MNRVTILLLSALLMLWQSSDASAEITKSESFDVSNVTSLKILEPAGAHVFVTVQGAVKDDNIPAIFSLPNADAYLVVKVTMPDGESWSGKVEVKAGRQTVVRFAQTKKAAAAAAPVRRLSGRLINDTGIDKCDSAENFQFVVSKEGTTVFTSQMVINGNAVNVALEPGRYVVTLVGYGKTLASRAMNVASEPWTFASGCVSR